MRKIKAILCAVLSACILACPLTISAVPAGAADINSLEDKLDELNRKESEYQKTLDKTQSDINKKEKYSEALVGKIEVLTKKITVSNQSIDKLNEEIGVKQDAIERQQEYRGSAGRALRAFEGYLQGRQRERP